MRYDETQVAGPEANLKLMHRVDGFVNVTTSVDTENDIICGTTTHLSIFVVAESSGPVGGIVEMEVKGSASGVDSAADSSEASSPRNHIALAGLVALTAGAWYARRRWLG